MSQSQRECSPQGLTSMLTRRMRHHTVVRLRHKADVNCLQSTSSALSPRPIIHTFTELRDEVERGVRELGGV
jgi:hypothetical protein